MTKYNIYLVNKFLIALLMNLIKMKQLLGKYLHLVIKYHK